MHVVLLLLLIVAVLFGPQLWARHVFRRYAAPRDDFPGSGGELARHLLDHLGMADVLVEVTDRGDHYDPEARTVRLSPENHDGRSLTAIAVAAHEVGHAIQHRRGEPLLGWRTRLVTVAQAGEKAGAMAMMALPLVIGLTRAPSAGLIAFAIGIGSLAIGALVHLVTLPVEIDASFRKALPLLRAGRYVEARDEPAVRRILGAAALTYVAASLAGLLNLWRWIAILRR